MKDIVEELREAQAQLLSLTTELEALCRRHESHGDKLGFARALRAIMKRAEQSAKGQSMAETQETPRPR
jgi:hypothetical protein